MLSIKKGVLGGILFLLLIFCGLEPVSAETLEDLVHSMQAEMKQLRQRVEELEERNAELEQRVVNSEQQNQQQEQNLAALHGGSSKSAVRSKYPVDFYGYIKLDASYDDSRTDEGNFARWVRPEGSNDDDDQFNMTARQSRFGLKMDGPDVGGARTSGRVEVDFYEGGAENKNRLMMRHAYGMMEWPDHDFNLIFGQTSDVISPLVPFTVNYPVAWWSGDIGYRRPQIRLTKGFEADNDSRLQLQGAVTRTIGDDSPFGMGADTGEDAGFPTLQGRVSYAFPLFNGRRTTLGLSGHWGEEEYDTDAFGSDEHLDTWSANLDLHMPVNEWFAFKGEIWTGENLDAYLGGIAQGVNMNTLEEIQSTGGWASLEFGPFDKWTFNLGGSIDDPDDEDLSTGDRAQNISYWGSVLYDVNEAVQLGFELSYWDTEYEKADDADAVRVQTSLSYRF
jgi:hypothetical protein